MVYEYAQCNRNRNHIRRLEPFSEPLFDESTDECERSTDPCRRWLFNNTVDCKRCFSVFICPPRFVAMGRQILTHVFMHVHCTLRCDRYDKCACRHTNQWSCWTRVGGERRGCNAIQLKRQAFRRRYHSSCSRASAPAYTSTRSCDIICTTKCDVFDPPFVDAHTTCECTKWIYWNSITNVPHKRTSSYDCVCYERTVNRAIHTHTIRLWNGCGSFFCSPSRCIYRVGHVCIANKRVYACWMNCKHTQIHLLTQTQRHTDTSNTTNNCGCIGTNPSRITMHVAPTHTNNMIWMLYGVKLFMQNTISPWHVSWHVWIKSAVCRYAIVIIVRESAQNWHQSIVDIRLSIIFENGRTYIVT